jgi:hypothetical protein
MNITEMVVRQYLEANGFDGLYHPGECACKKEDLFPCGDPHMAYCKPGYLAPCPPGECGEHDWHIVANRSTAAGELSKEGK